ncbi:MAG: protein translocase subunit SecDF [Rikenella sp.]|nr:protein translocase subunit SecDF [Rikenella sp.]
MQNKGALKFLAIMLAIACAFQLSFSFVTHSVRSDAEKASGGNSAVEQAYLDSMKSQVVYNLGLVKYTYAECQEKEINLGLDLQGGMNITLEIAVEDVLKALSNHSTDPAFLQAMAEAKKAMNNSTDDFITLFADAYRRVAPEGRLAAIFGTYELRDKIKSESTNEQVIRVLRESCDAAIANSFNVLSTRIDRFGVIQPNIQRIGNTGRILVELPGIKDPERVRKLLQGTASLEFWTTYTAKELLPMMMQANEEVAKVMAAQTAATTADSTAAATTTATTATVDSTDILAALGAAQEQDGTLSAAVAQQAAAGEGTATSLFSILQPMQDGGVIGMAQSYDTAKVNTYLNMPQIRALFPRDVRFLWSVKGIKGAPTLYELYAIKGSSDGRPALDGSVITDAVGQYGQTGSAAEVSMSMNAAGAKTWARLTADNVGKFIAVVLDGYVYSCPRVNGEIAGGHSQITGDFTIAEAKDLANILQSGRLPAPAQIVQEAVVGPSLGQESINAGMTSFVLAFVLVLIYMLFFYNTAGFVANIALVANLFFLFGVLVSFGAVLTLPGIAGIVLTMGMAVDANVIIYERIKEELHAGKGLSLSIADGFKNAYSAIIDGQVTTLITGIVLFIFGTGPVQGFATTLIIGILTSLFCAIFITRLIFVAMLDKGRNIRFWNRLTEYFMAHTHIDFLKVRKISYIVSGVAMIVMVISLATKGLSYGVDFSGGRAYVVRFDKPVTANEVRDALDNVFTDGMEVKQYGNKDQMQMRIVTQYKYADDTDGVTDEINHMLYDVLKPLYAQNISFEEFTTTVTNPFGIISTEKVGPSIAHDIKVNSFIAVIFSLIAIGIYIAIRFKNWQYGMGGVISLFHDALLTIGIFSLLYGLLPFNLTVDQSFIAAILTIIGYSINDKVVIFDRIRENMNLFPRRSRRENINLAINSTLARTINTSGSTFVVLLAIFIFGGEVIRGFVFALMFGVIVGTYSSVFIATPVAYDMMTRKDKKTGKTKSQQQPAVAE